MGGTAGKWCSLDGESTGAKLKRMFTPGSYGCALLLALIAVGVFAGAGYFSGAMSAPNANPLQAGIVQVLLYATVATGGLAGVGSLVAFGISVKNRRLVENYRAAQVRRLAEDGIASSTVLTVVSVSILIVLGFVLYERKKAERKWTTLGTTRAYVHLM